MQGVLLINNWTSDVNDILDKIRINSIVLSNEHKKTYFLLSSRIKWFRIPVIFLSALGSIFGIGLSPYLQQLLISEVCSVMSLVVGLIGSLELFLAISTKMENELVQSKELYLLAIEIQKTLLLDIENRNGDGMAYLEDKFNVYSKLIENSYLLECKIMDELTPLPNKYQSKIVSKQVSSDSPPKSMQHRFSKQLNNNMNILRHQVAPLLSPRSNDVPFPAPFPAGTLQDEYFELPRPRSIHKNMSGSSKNKSKSLPPLQSIRRKSIVKLTPEEVEHFSKRIIDTSIQKQHEKQEESQIKKFLSCDRNTHTSYLRPSNHNYTNNIGHSIIPSNTLNLAKRNNSADYIKSLDFIDNRDNFLQNIGKTTKNVDNECDIEENYYHHDLTRVEDALMSVTPNLSTNNLSRMV